MKGSGIKRKKAIDKYIITEARGITSKLVNKKWVEKREK